MKRVVAAIVAAALFLDATRAAVCAHAQAADPFAEVIVPAPHHRSHLWAYGCIGAGVTMIAASFEFAHRANRTYDRYLAATEPVEIGRLYDRTVREDRLASGSLLGGEALVALGLYLRFLRRPAGSSLSLDLGPRRCALAWRF